MTIEYNQNEYNRVAELFTTIRKKIEQSQAIAAENERATLLQLLNDFEKEFTDEIENKAKASFNVIKADKIIQGHLHFLLEAQKCIDVLTDSSYSLEFKSESLAKLQESGESANISKRLSSKAGALFMGMLCGIIPTAIAAVPLIIFGGPIGIAAAIAVYLTISAVFYVVAEKTARKDETVYKLASRFMLFNSGTHVGHECKSYEDEAPGQKFETNDNTQFACT